MSDADPRIRRLERQAGTIAVVVGVVLLAVKFAAWWLTGSAAAFSDALESIVNVVASLVALWAVRSAHRPADRTHPYGHGRFEILSAGFEGGMIAVAGGVIVARAVEVFLRGGSELGRLDAGVILMAVTVLANGGVGAWLLGVGRRWGSPSLRADGWHLISDALTTVAVIAALLVVRLTGWTVVDPIAALVMGVVLCVLGLRILRRSLGDLVDEQEESDVSRLEALLDAHCGTGGRAPRICGWHKLRVRHVGREHWVEFHVQLPARMPLQEAHAAATEIELEIEGLMGPGNATAHTEPCGRTECERCAAVARAS